MKFAPVVWALLTTIGVAHGQEIEQQQPEEQTQQETRHTTQQTTQQTAQQTTVPSYTNADLVRVRPLRGQTGGTSRPAHHPPEIAVRTGRQEATGSGRGEEYWRREAQKLRDKLEPYEDRVADLRDKIEALREDPRVLPYSDPRIEKWQARIATLERRRDERWERLRARARSAQVPPGWLR